MESSGHGFYQPAQNPSTYKYRDLTPLGRRANSIAHRNGSATTTNVLRNTKVKSTWIQKALLGLKPDQSIPSAGLMRATSMNSLLDPFLYELVRAHEQELLEAARVSRVLGTGNRRAFAA